jgi:hypothetical protein
MPGREAMGRYFKDQCFETGRHRPMRFGYTGVTFPRRRLTFRFCTHDTIFEKSRFRHNDPPTITGAL